MINLKINAKITYYKYWMYNNPNWVFILLIKCQSQNIAKLDLQA